MGYSYGENQMTNSSASKIIRARPTSNLKNIRGKAKRTTNFGCKIPQLKIRPYSSLIDP